MTPKLMIVGAGLVVGLTGAWVAARPHRAGPTQPGGHLSPTLVAANDAVVNRVVAKQEVTAALLRGELSLADAAERFRAANGPDPAALDRLRALYPEAGEAELSFRQVLHFARSDRRMPPQVSAARLPQLEAEFRARFPTAHLVALHAPTVVTVCYRRPPSPPGARRPTAAVASSVRNPPGGPAAHSFNSFVASSVPAISSTCTARASRHRVGPGVSRADRTRSSRVRTSSDVAPARSARTHPTGAAIPARVNSASARSRSAYRGLSSPATSRSNRARSRTRSAGRTRRANAATAA